MSLTLSYFVTRYLLVFLATALAMFTLDVAVTLLTDAHISGATSLVATVVPALDAGLIFQRRMGRTHSNLEAWQLSGLFMAVNVASVIVILTLIGGGALWSEVPVWAALAGLLVSAAVGLLLTRVCFGFAALSGTLRLAR